MCPFHFVTDSLSSLCFSDLLSSILYFLSDDVAVVYELKVTPEEEEAAMQLKLPANFYSYLRKPPCPGCAGCEPDSDPEV